MPLSANEIRTLNELARLTAEEDPDYVRRLMTHGAPVRGARRRAPRASFRVPTFRDVLRGLRSARRVLLPLLLVGAVLAGGVVGASIIAMNSGDVAHVRPDGPDARLQP
ncbi:hypothetical protein [Spirillospora sp. NPDC029432]|uniref:hypothetical protein n=1 Tax=Spirillospora sp. NPDC029432 TaxID=3154599 RepID=UPI0034571D68